MSCVSSFIIVSLFEVRFQFFSSDAAHCFFQAQLKGQSLSEALAVRSRPSEMWPPSALPGLWRQAPCPAPHWSHVRSRSPLRPWLWIHWKILWNNTHVTACDKLCALHEVGQPLLHAFVLRTQDRSRQKVASQPLMPWPSPPPGSGVLSLSSGGSYSLSAPDWVCSVPCS